MITGIKGFLRSWVVFIFLPFGGASGSRGPHNVCRLESLLSYARKHVGLTWEHRHMRAYVSRASRMPACLPGPPLRVHDAVLDSLGGDSQENFLFWVPHGIGTREQSGPNLAYLFFPPRGECWAYSPGQDHISGCLCPWPSSSPYNCIQPPNPPPPQLN